MKRALMIITLAAAAAAGWWFRPWSPYAPARLLALDDPERYPETFQRFDSFLPHRTIAARDPQPFERALRPLTATYRFNEEARTLEAFLARSRALSLVVLHDGRLVHERYFYGAGPETRFTSWSVAKSFVATAIARGLETGRIESLEDRAADHAARFAGTDYGTVSLRHLLMMASGMDFVEDYEAENSDIRRFFFQPFLFGRNVDAMAAAIERNRPAGQDLDYISSNTQVLAAAARGAFETDLADLMEAEIWTPLGMEGEATWIQNKPGQAGVALGYCCLQARTVDFARLGELYRLDGVWNGERLLPEGWAEAVGSPQAPFQAPGPDGVYAPRGYGLHFWIAPPPGDEFFATGIYGQYVWIDRARGVVIAVNAADTNWYEHRREAYAVMRAIAAEVAGSP